MLRYLALFLCLIIESLFGQEKAVALSMHPLD
jgi:hypothetical protein